MANNEPKTLREILIGLQNSFRDLEEAPDRLRKALNNLGEAPARFRDGLNDAINEFSQLPHRFQQLQGQIRDFLAMLDREDKDDS